VHAYESTVDPNPALALVKGDVSDGEPTLVRVHSSCITGDLLSSLRCDCGDQLHLALQRITQEGKGAVIYLEQEGRGIGMVNKMRAYALQDQGLDTVEANEALDFKADLRDYGIGAQIMVDLGLKKLRLLTNNPKKVAGIEGYGLEIVESVPIKTVPNVHNRRYLETKKRKLGHIFSDTDFPPEGGEYKDE
jgi:3,4-dihydroxy 2-butanone 4-phosphate synthase/GTP cyclohydrolase II